MILKMICFNGLVYTVKEDATHEDMRKLLHEREEQGYEVSWLSPMEAEVNSDGLIDDRMGWLKLTS